MADEADVAHLSAVAFCGALCVLARVLLSCASYKRAAQLRAWAKLSQMQIGRSTAYLDLLDAGSARC